MVCMYERVDVSGWGCVSVGIYRLCVDGYLNDACVCVHVWMYLG